ncbi:molybdopterin-dependent oxidoreductase [Chloroflexota bacterium]
MVRGFCAQCTGGPHPINFHITDGVLTRIEPNRDLGEYVYCPEGRPACPKSNYLIHKVYNPNRVKAPMIRTNPEKGRGIDPKWEEISWDEALDIVAGKLQEIRQRPLDENGHPRLGVHTGSAGMEVVVGGTLYAFLSAFGPIDYSMYAQGAITCYHSEHYYSEMWHRAFVCTPDSKRVKWLLSLGRNDYSTWQATGQNLKSRAGDFKRIQVDPHLTVTGAVSDEWIPIKPRTDYALLLAMTHVILHEMDWHKACDIDFLKSMTNSPYLIGPNGHYVRDPITRKPLIWDPVDGKAKTFDADDIKDFALEGEYKLKGLEIGPDKETWEIGEGTVSFELLRRNVKDFTPEWASKICEIGAETIRRLAREYVDNAMLGARGIHY